MNIYVGNLPYSITEDALKAIFAEFGVVQSVHIIMDKISGRSKGFGFVEMEEESAGAKAVAALHESDLEGRNIIVDKAKSNNERAA
ncbi:MAG: RNA-binding protein [Methylococcales bacterium]|jgi:RNA recognition motif-containing protein|nr:RNA-binding protein [Methylococcales bacterium]MBT7445826.1 RNA-binding protein [Methylococcales bacterium]